MIPAHELYQSERGFEHQMLQAHRYLGLFSKQVQRAVAALHAGQSLKSDARDALRDRHDELYARFVEDYLGYSRLRKCELENREFLMSLAMPLCVELARARFVLKTPALQREMRELQGRARPENTQDYDVLFCFTHMRAHYDVPVLQMSQSQWMDAVWSASELLLTLRYKALGEYRRTVELLWVRAGQLLCQWSDARVLDVPEMRQAHPHKQQWMCNRTFMIFCTIYLNALARPLYWHDAFGHALHFEMDAWVRPERIRRWLATHVCASLGEDTDEAFVDLYNDTRVLAYVFPGDDEWFRFCNPNQVINARTRGQVIDAIRPQYRDPFFTDAHLQLKHILAALERHDHQSYVSRKFLLYGALNHYFKLKFPSVFSDENRFTDTFVVCNADIEKHSVPLMHPWYPVLMELVSEVWVFYDGRVWVTSDLCAAIGCWFWIIKTYKRGRLHDERVHLDEMLAEIECDEAAENEDAQRIILH